MKDVSVENFVYISLTRWLEELGRKNFFFVIRHKLKININSFFHGD